MLKIKSIQYSLVLFFLFCFSWSQAQGIEFAEGTWDEIKTKAQKENKIIFVDAYTTWCGPCKWMASTVFTQENVGAYFKDNFIAYKMDMEKGEGPDFAQANNIMAYPTLLYFSASGEMLHKAVGARDADGLVSLSNEALDPEKQLATVIKKYKSGNRDKEFMAIYLRSLSSSGDDITEPFEEYWKMLNDSEKQTKEGLEMMTSASQYFSDMNHPLTQYLVANKAAYEKVAGKEHIAMLFNNCYINSIWQIAKITDKKEQDALGKQLLELCPEHKVDYSKQLAYIKTTMEANPSEAKIKKAYAAFLKVTNDAGELNSAAWDAYENSDDPKELKQALGWIDRAIGIQKNYYNLDTKASLLYKLKQYEEAQKFAEEAVKAAEKEGMGKPESTLELLENIKAKLKK